MKFYEECTDADYILNDKGELGFFYLKPPCGCFEDETHKRKSNARCINHWRLDANEDKILEDNKLTLARQGEIEWASKKSREFSKMFCEWARNYNDKNDT